MTVKFQIEELIEESRSRTVHRVRGEDGRSLRLTRILLDEDHREQLKRSELIREALEELKDLRHPSLSEVVDCGLDEKGIPWVMSQWEKGKSVGEVRIEEREIETVSRHAKRLLDDFGPVAGAVNFEAAEIVFTDEERKDCRFAIDYFRWFANIAAGIGPGSDRDGKEEVRQLLSSLAIKQLQLPMKKEEQPAIPFVDDRSPALRTYEPVKEPWFVRSVVWLFLIASIAVIGWLTVEGMGRMKNNPRKENWEMRRD